ncbi:hypothetical protein AAC387_Pa01g2737 [Persea americana]
MSEVELEEERPSPHIFIPDTWIEAADSIAFDSTTTPIAFVCGPKNTGKSTFSRHLLNTLLNRYRKVAYLDTDVGQPEFTTPGCLSLHVIHERTPDLTILSLKTPERCLFFGDTSSKRDPKTYLDNILRLYDYFHTEYYQSNELKSPRRVPLPLVINTAGWVKGIGYDILVEMLRHISPTHVVKMRVSVESKNLPSGAFWFDESQKGHVSLIEISSTFRDSLKRSVIQKDAHLLRDTRIMAYFRQCFPREMNITTSEELAHALASHPPYEVPTAKIKIMHLHCQVPDSEVSYSLNATIVGLAVSCTKPESSTPWCVGLGIVRAVDVSKGLLYVITPVAQHNLEKVDILLQGFIEIPTRLLQVSGCMSPYMSTTVLPKTRATESGHKFTGIRNHPPIVTSFVPMKSAFPFTVFETDSRIGILQSFSLFIMLHGNLLLAWNRDPLVGFTRNPPRHHGAAYLARSIDRKLADVHQMCDRHVLSFATENRLSLAINESPLHVLGADDIKCSCKIQLKLAANVEKDMPTDNEKKSTCQCSCGKPMRKREHDE